MVKTYIALTPNTNHGSSVIIPMYNEEDNVLITLKEVKKVLKTCESYQIIAVNDGSSDRTLELLEEYARENPELVYLIIQ